MSMGARNAVADVLGLARRKGLKLWCENGELRYRAPKGSLTPQEIEQFRACKGQLVAYLEAASSPAAVLVPKEPAIESSPRLRSAPLAFSQLAHWNLYGLYARPSKRLLASATRLRGVLSFAAFETSVSAIVRRHDTLRTRIVLRDGVPEQQIDDEGVVGLGVEDLTHLSAAARAAAVDRALEEVLVEPVDVAVDPLFVLRLLKVAEDEHVLILGMEHMIADGHSRGILLHDLFTAYTQALRGRPIALPEIPLQFPAYALWQRRTEKSWLETHGRYWSQRMAGATRARFPSDQASLGGAGGNTQSGWSSVPIHIGRELKSELREWCREHQTTLVMSMFTVCVALVLRWCDTAATVLQYQSNSRVRPEIEHTVGYFASVLHLRVELLERDTFPELLQRLTHEYITAYEHADFSQVAARMPRPEFTRNSFFNWAPARSRINFSEVENSDGALQSEPIPFLDKLLTHLELDAEPGIQLCDGEEGISGDVYFPRGRFGPGSMSRFANQFLALARALVREPGALIKDIPRNQG